MIVGNRSRYMDYFHLMEVPTRLHLSFRIQSCAHQLKKPTFCILAVVVPGVGLMCSAHLNLLHSYVYTSQFFTLP